MLKNYCLRTLIGTLIKWVFQGDCGEISLVGKLNSNVPNKMNEKMGTVE